VRDTLICASLTAIDVNTLKHRNRATSRMQQRMKGGDIRVMQKEELRITNRVLMTIAGRLL